MQYIKAAKKVREGAVKPKEGVSLTDFYEQAMRGYTILQAKAPHLVEA